MAATQLLQSDIDNDIYTCTLHMHIHNCTCTHKFLHQLYIIIMNAKNSVTCVMLECVHVHVYTCVYLYMYMHFEA